MYIFCIFVQCVCLCLFCAEMWSQLGVSVVCAMLVFTGCRYARNGCGFVCVKTEQRKGVVLPIFCARFGLCFACIGWGWVRVCL